MHSSSPLYDVIIAGAGPVGLLLACELRLADLSVLVLEQAVDPASPLKRLPFGMRGLNAPTIDVLHRRGLLDAITTPTSNSATAAAPDHWKHQKRQAAGHFAGILFFQDRIDTTRWPYRLSDAPAAMLPSDMQQIETVLTQRALAVGVEIRRGMQVTQVTQSDTEVTVIAADETFRGQWLVGCDGGRSAVRKLCNFAFSGTAPEFTGYSLEVTLDDPTRPTPGRHHTANGMYTWQAPGTLSMADFDGGAFHRSGPITAAHVQSVLRRISGTSVRVLALTLASTWTDRAFQAEHYRQGRVLLAGDAAHTHSPLGGQGLNLGLGDAMNLGWKLAATVRGDAPEGLLDSYHQERHPVAAQVLDWSRAQVELMRPTAGARALASVVRDLIDTRDGATYFAQRVSGVSLRYPLGDDHPLVGCSAPDFLMADGRSLAQSLRDGRGLLVDFENTPEWQAMAARWPGRVNTLTGPAREQLGLRALLIRPDGVVAWVATDHGDDEALQQAMTRWFGPPN